MTNNRTAAISTTCSLTSW